MPRHKILDKEHDIYASNNGDDGKPSKIRSNDRREIEPPGILGPIHAYRTQGDPCCDLSRRSALVSVTEAVNDAFH